MTEWKLPEAYVFDGRTVLGINPNTLRQRMRKDGIPFKKSNH